MQKPNGAVIFRGPSRINGAEIVVIVTGLERASDNVKTGDMLQTWILLEDTAPHVAVKQGLDVGICGGCPHRGKLNRETGLWEDRTCYVTVFQTYVDIETKKIN